VSDAAPEGIRRRRDLLSVHHDRNRTAGFARKSTAKSDCIPELLRARVFHRLFGRRPFGSGGDQEFGEFLRSVQGELSARW
jgi:hypothetical protein